MSLWGFLGSFTVSISTQCYSSWFPLNHSGKECLGSLKPNKSLTLCDLPQSHDLSGPLENLNECIYQRTAMRNQTRNRNEYPSPYRRSSVKVSFSSYCLTLLRSHTSVLEELGYLLISFLFLAGSYSQTLPTSFSRFFCLALKSQA